MGQKSWETTAEEIMSHSTDSRLPSDRLSAVFVRQEELSDCKAAMLSAMEKGTQPWRLDDNEKEPKGNGVSRWGSHVWQLDFPIANKGQTTMESSLNEHLRNVIISGGLLIIATTSLEQSIDLLINLDQPIQHLSLLAASTPKEVSYVKDWVKAYSFSKGHVSTNLRPSKLVPPTHSTIPPLTVSSFRQFL